MAQNLDLTSAAEQMTTVLRGVSDEQLSRPTPCPAYTVGDLIDHIGGLAVGFTWAATKELPPEAGGAPSGDASRLPQDWREEFPRRLQTMAEVWRDAAAWDGMTQAGGVDLPGQVAGLVAANELVVHGWDLAVSTGQPYAADPPSIQGSLGFVGPFSTPEAAGQRDGVFGPIFDVGDDASDLDRLLGLTGRDPAWTPRR